MAPLALLFLLAAPPDDYEQHVRATREKYGAALDDLTPIIERPFVVWGEPPDARTVRWAVERLERDFFAARPDGIYDVFLFKDAESYRRHAKQMWNEVPSTPFGYASSQHRALVMNIATGGGTLVHEIVHPYVAANFTDAPTWLNEGLASLYEQSSERDGHIVGLTNWRLAGLQSALASGSAGNLAQLVTMSDAQFRDEDEGLHYAQARYLMMYLQEEELLRDFIARALKDESAAHALRATLGEARWKSLDRVWRKWVMALRYP